MRKILSLLIIAYLIGFFAVTPCFAVTNTATKAGNWSDTTVWDQGHVPADGEDVALAGYTIVWDVANIARIPATGTLATITAATTGTITVDISDAACHTSGTCQINFTTAAAGTEHLFQITGTTDHDVTFNGTSITASSGTSNKHGIFQNSPGGRAIVNATLIGSSGSTGDGMSINASGGLATATKGATGGGASGAYGIYNNGNAASILTVSGSSNVTGGSQTNACGIGSSTGAAATVVIDDGVKLVNSNSAMAICNVFTWSGTTADYWTIAGTNYYLVTTVSSGGGAWAY